MPFGLTNAPSSFMRLVNHVLMDCIGKCVVFYFDDIIVYIHSLESHLINNNLFSNIKKCTFCVDIVAFLGFIVNKIGVHVDPEKIKATQEWPTPQNVDIRNFHGLTSFYKCFVPNFLV